MLPLDLVRDGEGHVVARATGDHAAAVCEAEGGLHAGLQERASRVRAHQAGDLHAERAERVEVDLQATLVGGAAQHGVLGLRTEALERALHEAHGILHALTQGLDGCVDGGEAHGGVGLGGGEQGVLGGCALGQLGCGSREGHTFLLGLVSW